MFSSPSPSPTSVGAASSPSPPSSPSPSPPSLLVSPDDVSSSSSPHAPAMSVKQANTANTAMIRFRLWCCMSVSLGFGGRAVTREDLVEAGLPGQLHSRALAGPHVRRGRRAVLLDDGGLAAAVEVDRESGALTQVAGEADDARRPDRLAVR